MSGASLPKRPSTSLAFQLPCCYLQLQHGLLLDQVQYIKTSKQPGVQHPPCQIGPVENRLINYGRVRGWIFGAFGECCDEVHTAHDGPEAGWGKSTASRYSAKLQPSPLQVPWSTPGRGSCLCTVRQLFNRCEAAGKTVSWSPANAWGRV